MPPLLDIDTTAFTVLEYKMSWIELVGTVLSLLSVWLIARRNILTWPIGIASVILYGILFYQIRLYADTIEQVYYFVISIYGWWAWNRASRTEGATLTVRFSAMREILITIGATALLTIPVWIVVSRMHLWFPTVITEPASFPFLDALTTVMSFTAMWIQTRRRTESWIYWIVVDILGVGLYWTKDVKFVALLYFVLLAMAFTGLRKWRRGEPVEAI